MIPINPLTDTCTADTAQGKRYMVMSFPPIGTVNSSQVVNLRFKNNKTICTGKKVYNSNAQHENQQIIILVTILTLLANLIF